MARRRRRTAKRSYVRFSYLQVFVGALALLIAGLFVTNKIGQGKPSVLGVATSAYRSYNVTWSGVAGAHGYNIYYKGLGDKNWTYAVRNLPDKSTSYTISYLTKNKVYSYVVKAFGRDRREFWTSSVGTIPASN